MERDNIKAAIEAVLFASGEELSLERIASATGLDASAVNECIDEMMNDYDAPARGIKLIRMEDCVRLVTKPKYAPEIKNALDTGRVYSLSQQALEVLAATAYNQPVTRAYIDQIRGVDSSYSLQNLIERGLVEEAGTLDAPGRPKLYVTTHEFLKMFGLSSIDELPKPEENKSGGDKNPSDAQ
ncbi:MAG: SMC-Scp complex subunit ScpB [Clostridia bacterium]|nr:SMC-Scp complex subunit ScpB [Clostridia bacterium]